MSQTCFRCDAELSGDVASVEHIVPNALGGRLKSRALLCKKCNSVFGDTIDAALIKQLLPVANALDIPRERGETPPVRVTLETGEQYRRDADGNMRPYDSRPSVVEGDREVSISFAAATPAKARKHLEGLKRKYPKLDVEAVMSNVRMRTTYVNMRTIFELPPLGGAEAFRAIVKVAVSYYLHVGGDPNHIRDAIDVVTRNALPPIERVGCLYGVDPIPDRDKQIAAHWLAVVSDDRGILYSYVELFSAFRFVVRLAENYCGPRMCSAYGYDVCTGNEIYVDPTQLRGLPWTPEDWDREPLDKALQSVLAVAEARNQAAWNQRRAEDSCDE